MRLKHKFMALAAVGALSLSAIAPVASMASATRAAKPNIVQTAVAAGQFKTLVVAREAGRPRGTLRATARSPSSRRPTPRSRRCRRRRSTRSAKDKAKLSAVLLYHVAKGRLTAAKVVKRSSIKTLNGASVSVRVAQRQGLRGRRARGHAERRRATASST